MAVIIGELEAKLQADVSSFISGMRQATQAFQNTQSSINSGSQSLNGLNSSLNTIQGSLNKVSTNMNRMFGAIGAGFILPQIFGAAKSAVIDFNQQVDQATVALTNFLGSGSAAKDMIGELQDFAARTPFQFKDLLGTTQSMMAMGVAADQILPRMEAIGDAAAAMGGSPEVLQRIQRALGQIQAKGRVQSEELLQLAEAGIPAYKYIADAMGTTTSELMDSMKKGAVDSTTAISALLDGMKNDFGGMMEEQSKTMMGAMSTVMDYVQITIGAIFRPFFETLRDAFVAISELLSSNDMKTSAANFAKSVASVISQVRSLIAAFAGKLKKPFDDLVKSIANLGKVAVRVMGAMKPMITGILIPLGAAFIAISSAIMPVLKAFTSLVEVATRNQVVLYAIAGLLTGKMLMGFTASGKAAGAFTGAISKLFNMFGGAGKEASQYFRILKADGVGTFAAIKQASAMAGMSIKAFGAAMKVAMIELLPLMIGFMILGKAMEAFSNRNKDAKERTAELTSALVSQTDAILAQENALSSLANSGLGTLNDALVATGKEGEETTNALISLGKSSSDYVQVMRDFKNGTEQSAFALAKQKGFTDAQATAMANYVKTADKGKDSQHRATMEVQGFTPAMIAATMQLEQLDDASENTNFVTMTQGIINATIRSNEATQQFYNQAKAEIATAKATGEKMTKDEEAIKIYERFIALAKGFEEQQLALEKANAKLGITTDTVTERMNVLIGSMKDGKVASEDYLRALMGTGKYSQVMAEQSFFSMGVALNEFSKKLKETKGNQNALTSTGYDFLSMVGENQASILAMGGTLGDVDSAMKQMVDTFYKQGQMAGWSKDQLTKVLQTMGLLKENGDIILTVDVRIQGLEELRKTALALGDTQMFNAITKQLFDMNKQKERSLNLDLKSINLGDKSGSKKTVKTLKELREAIKDVYEDGLAKATEKIKEAKEAQNDYAVSISDTIRGSVSLSDSYNQVAESNQRVVDSVKNSIVALGSFVDIINDQKAATNALTQAQSGQRDSQTEVNNLQAEQLRLLAKYGRASSREEQLAIQDELARNTEALTKAEEKLALAKKATSDAEEEQNKTGKTFLDGLKKRVEAAKVFASQLTQLRSLGLNESALSQIISAGAEVGGQMASELITGAQAGLGSITETNRLVSELEDLGKTTGQTLADTLYNSGATGAQSTIDAMMVKAEEATKFAERIKTLVALGLSEENIQSILDAGASAGTKVADQLIAGGSTVINKANQITQSLKDAADSAGVAAASKYYDTGVAFAKAIYDGLKAQWDLLKPKLDGMTAPQLQGVLDTVSTTVPAYVGQTPAAPSIMEPAPVPTAPIAPVIAPAQNRQWWRDKFLEERNKHLGTKYKSVTDYIKGGATAARDKARQQLWDDYVVANNVPALAKGGIVNSATLALIGENGPEAVIPLSKLNSGGGDINIVVHAGLGTNGSQVGQQIVNELIAWQRRNGSLPVKVQQ